MTGIVDSGPDITIVSGKLFKEVAAAARLKKKDFLPADKVPLARSSHWMVEWTWTSRLENVQCARLCISHDGLLQLLEGGCRQLGILSYYQDVKPKEEIVKTVTPKDECPVVPMHGTC